MLTRTAPFAQVVAVILTLAVVLPWTVLAAPFTQETIVCAEVYTVQADDWLSKIADKFLGDMAAYAAIFAATKQQHRLDETFAQITDPDLIEVGWQLCIPTTETAETLLVEAASTVDTLPLEPADLTVFAAASLTDAFSEIGQNFEAAHPGVTLTFNFAGSQQLAQQLGQGAPADVFASANNTQMDVALTTGRVVNGTQKTFVRNRLVAIYPNDNPGNISQLSDLARPGVKLILAAAEVPVGRYSLEFLDKAAQEAVFGAGFRGAMLANVVSYEPNVRVVLTKIALGEGDAGIVYSSDLTGSEAEQINEVDIPDALNTIATYPIAPVNDTIYPNQAAAFIDYVLSPAGQATLADYGFMPMDE